MICLLISHVPKIQFTVWNKTHKAGLAEIDKPDTNDPWLMTKK